MINKLYVDSVAGRKMAARLGGPDVTTTPESPKATGSSCQPPSVHEDTRGQPNTPPSEVQIPSSLVLEDQLPRPLVAEDRVPRLPRPLVT